MFHFGILDIRNTGFNGKMAVNLCNQLELFVFDPSLRSDRFFTLD